MSPPTPPGELTLQEKRAARRAAKRRNTGWLKFAAVPLAIVGALFLAWLVDTTINSGNTTRNIELAGHGVGGLDDEDLTAVIIEVAEDYGQTVVEIRLPDRTITTTAAESGLAVDVEATAADVEHVGNESPLLRPFLWLGRWISPAKAELHFAAADLSDAPALISLEEEVTVDPVEPSVTFVDGEFRLVPGESGAGISAVTVLEQLPEAAADGADPIVVEAAPQTIAPETTDAALQTSIDEWNAKTAAGLTISAGGEATRQFGAGEVRSWLVLTVDGAEITATADPEALTAMFNERFPDVGDIGVPGPITIVDGKPEAEPGEPGSKCCAADSGDRILAAIEDGSGSVELDLVTIDRGDDYLQELGIVELVGEFTTDHACCQSRVSNIQRLAEIIRGQIVLPGEHFSVNEFVGPRTTEKGFVGGGVIYQGVFRNDVGGGISQYITTFFNAVFFAGLDYATYQAHTIYISRYPYGREATISYPAPDFAIVNTSEFPVMIWSTWTDTSITVELYSTKHIEVEETGQASEASGACTRVTTFRERTYPDGEVVDDSVFALYQPGEGIGCDGRPTVPPTPTSVPVPTAEPTAEPPPPEPTAEPTAEPPPPEPTAEPTAEPPPPEPTAEPTAEPPPPG